MQTLSLLLCHLLQVWDTKALRFQLVACQLVVVYCNAPSNGHSQFTAGQLDRAALPSDYLQELLRLPDAMCTHDDTNQTGRPLAIDHKHHGIIQKEPTTSRRSLLQNIDPLANPLRTSACVDDSSIFPFSTFGKLVSNTSSGNTICVATLIASNAAITRDYCLEVSS